MQSTLIGWSHSTINGSSGCDGCELYNAERNICFAASWHVRRLAQCLPSLYASDFSEVRLIPGRFAQAAAWPDLRGKLCRGKPWFDGKPRHIFVGDMGDFLSRAIPDEYLKRELIGAIESKAGQRHIWQLLTKHPRRLAQFAEKLGGLPDNVIAMTTVTDQATANLRLPWLLQVKCKWHSVSYEPALGFVDFSAFPPFNGHRISGGTIDQIIMGGASGTNDYPLHPKWVRMVLDSCHKAGVAFFFKQWGTFREWQPKDGEKARHLVAFDGSHGKAVEFSSDGSVGPVAQMTNIGKNGKTERRLDGKEYNGLVPCC